MVHDRRSFFHDATVVRAARLSTLDREQKGRLLATMLRIRAFEEALGDLHVERDRADRAFRAGEHGAEPFAERKRIRTPCHLYIGQEAVATGVCAALRADDWIWSTHRAHGHYLAKGGDAYAGFAEILCRSTGCARGRGGSMHLCAPEVGFLGSSSIVAGTVPLGVGAALAEFVRGSDRISVIFHGDAVPEEGVFHEVLNWAVLHGLPALFCCEDNQYSTHLHMRYRRKNQDLSQLVAGYGLPVVDVDGNDVRAVLEAAGPAIDRARQGGGPTFLHLHTYRWRGHVGPYDNLEVGLRSEEEIQAWMQRCPIEREKRSLLQEGVLDEDGALALERSVRREITAALEAAFDAPRPQAEEITRHVFRERE